MNIERMIKFEQLWPSPTLTVEHKNSDDLNKALASLILAKERAITSKGMPTPVAGVQSGLTAHWLEYNVLLWKDDAIEEFRRMVLAGVTDFFQMIGDSKDPGLQIDGISCWANVMRFGDSLQIHHHDPAFISAHYHVQAGNAGVESRSSGSTVYYRTGFVDRSHGGDAAGPSSPWDSEWRIEAPPIEGKLFIFPSYIRHEVRPYLGHSERISIAMDVYVKRQNALIYFAPPRWYVPPQGISVREKGDR
jgi:hypothetical protein